MSATTLNISTQPLIPLNLTRLADVPVVITWARPFWGRTGQQASGRYDEPASYLRICCTVAEYIKTT